MNNKQFIGKHLNFKKQDYHDNLLNKLNNSSKKIPKEILITKTKIATMEITNNIVRAISKSDGELLLFMDSTPSKLIFMKT